MADKERGIPKAVRELCLAFPGVEEFESHGAPNYRAREGARVEGLNLEPPLGPRPRGLQARGLPDGQPRNQMERYPSMPTKP